MAFLLVSKGFDVDFIEAFPHLAAIDRNGRNSMGVKDTREFATAVDCCRDDNFFEYERLGKQRRG